LKENQTWDLVQLPSGRSALRGKWVYKLKRGPDGRVVKHKARWVVKGFEQQFGIDYDQTFAAVVKPMSYKVLFAMAAQYDWEIEQMDVKTAFLHGKLQETVYMEQPTGYQQGNKVCKLNRALYGLKQAPRVWYQTMEQFLKLQGFQKIQADHSVFKHSNGTVVAVYVDDLLLFGADMSKIQALKTELSKEFDMTDLGPCSQYLGMQITQNRQEKTLHMSQKIYLDKVLCTFGMADCKPVSTPMAQGVSLVKETDKTATIEHVRRFQSAVGSLMYAMIETRPDIAFAVSTISQFASNPNEEHWKALKHLFCYLQGSLELGISYGKPGDQEIVGYTDSHWAGDKGTRKSTSGYLFKLGNGAVSWSSKRQPTVAISSCEAEYMAATQCVKEAIWLQGLLGEIGYQGKTRRLSSCLGTTWWRWHWPRTLNTMHGASTLMSNGTLSERRSRKNWLPSITCQQTEWWQMDLPSHWEKRNSRSLWTLWE
jgi:hypothetical protein